MTIDELTQKVLELMPNALIDEEFGSGELMISSGLIAGPDGKLRKVDNVFGEN